MLDELLDTAPCGFVSFAEDSTILLVNRTLTDLLGYTPAQLVGQRAETLLSAGSRMFYQTHVFPLLQMSGQIEEIYLVLCAQSGQDVPVLVNGVRRQRAGMVVNDCILVPMRQRDRFEDELLQAKKQAQEATGRLTQANHQLQAALLQLEAAHAELQRTQAQLVQSEKMRALGQMIAGVAHEINNPTAFVASNVEYLAEVVPKLASLFAAYAPLRAAASPAQQSAIAALESALDSEYFWRDLPILVQESRDGLARIRDIVLTLRNFARLDETAMKPADINEGLRSTLQIVRPLCKGRVEIVEDYGELPQVVCRPRELNQVFLNLLMNAVQAIAGAGTIGISTAQRGEHVIVTIRDSGAGIDEANLQRLGEPFFTTKPVGEGTGLGLTISFGIVAGHQGRLNFASISGVGTTATLELPINHD